MVFVVLFEGDFVMTEKEIYEEFEKEWQINAPFLTSNLTAHRNTAQHYFTAAAKLFSQQIEDLKELAEMVEDNTKMPHQHEDLQTRLYCLAERAKEVLEKVK